MAKYLSIDEVIRAHAAKILGKESESNNIEESLNKLADSMGDTTEYGLNIADALDRVLNASTSGGSGSKEELLIEKTIQFPADRSTMTPLLKTYDLTAEECDNVLMNLESSDDGGKCHIEILGDNDFYYHVDFICHSITKTNSGTRINLYMSENTNNDLYLTVDKYEAETPAQYSLSFLNLNYENAYSLLNSITIRISKIID